MALTSFATALEVLKKLASTSKAKDTVSVQNDQSLDINPFTVKVGKVKTCCLIASLLIENPKRAVTMRFTENFLLTARR